MFLYENCHLYSIIDYFHLDDGILPSFIPELYQVLFLICFCDNESIFNGMCHLSVQESLLFATSLVIVFVILKTCYESVRPYFFCYGEKLLHLKLLGRADARCIS